MKVWGIMSCVINLLNKKTGVTYVYESQSYWDKNKQQPRNRRICIGKLDPDTGNLISSNRLRNPQITAHTENLKVAATVQTIGPLVILNAITEKLQLEQLMKSCFPKSYQQILTAAQYLASDGRALSHCQTWCKSHIPSMAPHLTSQRISELLTLITVNEKQKFFSKWMKKLAEDDFLCYDITSISSYSELNEYIKYGYNRDNESLPQLNLALLFGQNKQLPLYFERLPGSITDVSTLGNLIKTFKALNIGKLSYVMDKGFYSKKNIDGLFAARSKFLVSVPLNNKWLLVAIDKIYESIHGPKGYRKIADEVIYTNSIFYPWGDNKHRCYLHLYYNARARAEAIDKFNGELLEYKHELETGKENERHRLAYEMFFIIKMTERHGKKILFKQDAINQYIKRYTGFSALLSNSIKCPVEALQIYRNKDVVEKCFDDLKNQLDMKRLRMHSSTTTDGRLFIQFIALIYISALRIEMKKSELIKRYTARELLQETETITKINYSGKRDAVITEITKTQKEIFNLLNITPPVVS